MREKKRMLLLFFLAFLFFVLASVIDGAFTVKTYAEIYKGDWSGNILWIYALISLMSVASLLIGVAAFLGDWGLHSAEDYYALAILVVQPWILWLGGFLDVVSRIVQEYLWHEPQLWLNPTLEWVWLDPPATNGVPMIPYLFSRLLGFEHTVTIGMFFGVAVSQMTVFAVWVAYWKEA